MSSAEDTIRELGRFCAAVADSAEMCARRIEDALEGLADAAAPAGTRRIRVVRDPSGGLPRLETVCSGRIHKLKCDPMPFLAVIEGRKKFEFRLNDRGFETGDDLELACLDKRVLCRVTYILEGPLYGVPEGYIVMSIEKIREPITVEEPR